MNGAPPTILLAGKNLNFLIDFSNTEFMDGNGRSSRHQIVGLRTVLKKN